MCKHLKSLSVLARHWVSCLSYILCTASDVNFCIELYGISENKDEMLQDRRAVHHLTEDTKKTAAPV
jgi:hypothetical protein